EAFRQLDSTLSRQQHGTGLGLALTKRFAELHGGVLLVESELGKGSRFMLRLPLVPRSMEVPALAPGPLRPAASPRCPAAPAERTSPARRRPGRRSSKNARRHRRPPALE